MNADEENVDQLDSDSDDEDYVPSGVNDALSEEESGHDSNDDAESEEGEEPANKKRKTSKKRKNPKSVQPADEKENKEETPDVVKSSEELKKRASDLWEDFMKDVGSPVVRKKTSDEEPSKSLEAASLKTDDKPVSQAAAKVKITEIFEFAGEKVEVEKEVPCAEVASPATPSGISKKPIARPSRGGISNILGQLGKKGKLSTLEKSKLDWNKFKKEEGIDEELDTFNKGKNGYLEKQDFLQRTDLRRFEIEKEMRNKRRTLNR